jgi:transcriptional regulator with XRE-family HTH domain
MFNLIIKDAKPPVSYASLMETMGERIRRLRVARGLTQPEFGKLVGVSKSAVSQWEDDSTKNLKLTTVARVLEVLNTDLPYLVWGENRGQTAGGVHSSKSSRRRGGSES